MLTGLEEGNLLPAAGRLIGKRRGGQLLARAVVHSSPVRMDAGNSSIPL